MSTRRTPLSANPNAANSPLRGAAAVLAATAAKQRRSHASTQREDAYGQPPPAKRLMVDHGLRGSVKSPVKQKPVPPRGASRSFAAERTSQTTSHKLSEKEVDEVRKWQQNQRSRFPKLVFYFESIPDEQRARLAKQVAHLGAREEKFFSISITHVVTTRTIPADRPAKHKDEGVDLGAAGAEAEQPQTINPSLLSRSADNGGSVVSAKRKLFENAGGRRIPIQVQEDPVRRPKPARNVDILHRARDMGKKIWSLEKLQKVLDMLLEPDPYRSAALGYGSRSGSVGHVTSTSRIAEESALLQQLLHKERVSGPSDRDPTVARGELNYFKGPYIYIYDIEEKQKPIMVREYAKVADKKDGDWPQFRASGTGRCPFVEDTDAVERKAEKQRAKDAAAAKAAAAVQSAAPKLQPPEVPPPKPVTGKRTLAEMEDGQNRRPPPPPTSLRPTESFDAAKVTNPPVFDFQQPQNAFTSRAKAGRLFAGEPVASGVQPSGVTSAIRSQMISSATGTLGSKAGTSKAIHGLQRTVLQKSASTSQDPSSRRMAETTSMDHSSFNRSASVSHQPSRRKLDTVGESRAAAGRGESHKRTMSVPVQSTKQRRDPKPGYCENCQDKFDDFDDHILSRKHRKFAEDANNWGQLDQLLGELRREPRLGAMGGADSP